jgi:hypothetical protein
MATTSPLAAALKPSLPVDGESEAKYQSALSQLSAALEKRKNIAGDAADIGYLAGLNDPSVRGMGFAAEFASGLKGARAAQFEQAKEEQDVATLRLQIAQSEREMARRKAASQTIQSFLTGQQPPSAPAAGAPAAGAPEGAAAPARATGAAGSPIITRGDATGLGVITPNGRQITPAFILAFKQANPEEGKQLDEYYKQVIDSISVQPGGYVNKLTGEYTAFGGKAPVTRFLPGNAATGQKALPLELSEEDAIAFDRARRTGDAETLYRIVDMYTKAPARPGAPTAAAPGAAIAGPGAAPAGAARPAGSGSFAQTPSEAKAASEIEAEVRKKLALGEAEQQLKATGEVRSSGKAALGLLPIFDRAEQIVKTPGIENVLGVLERGDVKSALGSLAEEAIRVGNFNVGVPAVRKVLGQFGTPEEVIDRAAELGQLVAFLRFEQRKGLGSGTSVSNMEQLLANAMGPDFTDSLRTFKQKLSFMREKAKFEVDLAKTMRSKKMQYEEFEDTPEFEKMFNDYRNRQMNIVYPSGTPARPARPATPAAISMLGRVFDALGLCSSEVKNTSSINSENTELATSNRDVDGM